MSEEQDAYSSFQALLDRVVKARNEMSAARPGSPEFQAAVTKSASAMNHLDSEWNLLREDLQSTFDEAYRSAGGTGIPDRRYKDKAKRTQETAEKAFRRSTSDLRQWGQTMAMNTGSSKTRAALNAKLAKLEQSGASQAEINKVKGQIDSLPKIKDIKTDPTVMYRRKGKSYAVDAEAHVRMSVTTAHNLSRNMGVIAAAAKQSGWVLVQDGPACGRKGHNDGDKAHGQVWTVDEAFANPISHPNCTRRFFVAPGPPGSKKTNELRRQLGMLKSQRQKSKTQKAAEVIAGASMVASIGGAIITNPFTKRFIREILRDSDLDLAPAARRALTAIVSYAKKEATAFAVHGKRLGIASQEEFNKYILTSLDDDLATEAFITASRDSMVTIRAEQANTLGVPFRVRKDQLLEAIDDYGDWTTHRDFTNQPIWKRLTDQRIFGGARDDLYGQAATQFHVDRRPGANFDRGWVRVLKDLQTTYAKDPERAKVESIRLLASIVDPAPWLSFKLPNNFKFGIGMPSRSRQDLAEKVYLKLSGRGTLSAREIEWAEQLGMDLSPFKEVKFTAKDVRDLLAPRISYMPGKVFHATLGLERGVLKPIIRLYPPGTYFRFLSLESRLGRFDVEEFIRQLKRADVAGVDKLKEALGAAVEDADLITSINLFRNSPVALSLKINGVTPDAFALRLLPDNKLIRYSYQFSFDNTAYYRQFNFEELQQIAADRGFTGEYKSKNQVIASLQSWDRRQRELFSKELKRRAKEGESLVDAVRNMDPELQRAYFSYMDGWEDGLNVLPNRFFNFKLNGFNLEQREILMKLKVGGYDLIRIAKETRYGYDSLLELFAEWKNTAHTLKLDAKRISEAQSWEEFKRLARIEMRQGPSRADIAYANRQRQDIESLVMERVDPKIVNAMVDDRNLHEDMVKFYSTWTRQFPSIRPPLIRVVDDLAHPLMAKDGEILIRSEVVENWDFYTALRKKAVKIGHFPSDTNDMVATLMHEGAHLIVQSMDKQEIRRLVSKIIKSYQSWDVGKDNLAPHVVAEADLKFMIRWLHNQKIQQQLAKRVSGYSVGAIDEMLAEALSEYMASPNPRRIAETVGDFMTKEVSSTGVFKASFESKINKEFNKLVGQVDDIVKSAEKRLVKGKLTGVNDPFETYKPSWWFVDEDGFEDLEVDKILLDNADIQSDVKQAFTSFKALFPNVQFPRIRMMPTTLDPAIKSSNRAGAFFSNKTGMIYVPEATVKNYGLFQKMRSIATMSGWSPAGLREFKHTFVHETGHFIHTILDEADQVSLVKHLRETIGKAYFSADDLALMDKALAELPRYNPSGRLDVMHFFDAYLTGMGDSISDYAASNFFELIAEMFSVGMNDIERGVASPAAGMVRFMADLPSVKNYTGWANLL